jgi:hypothetical protein
MQKIGITNTEEIVEAMDCTQEEKGIRMNLINKVLMAKREYKGQLESLRSKASKNKTTTQFTTPGLHQDKSQNHTNAKVSDPEDVLNMTFSFPTLSCESKQSLQPPAP